MAAASAGHSDRLTSVQPAGNNSMSGESPAQLRVVVVGPVIPYRGGISQHTTLLRRALSQQCECLTVSFVRQYPHWLYPGETDRDSAVGLNSDASVEFLIDSLNPLTWEKAVRRIDAFDPNIVVLPWWHVYWAPCFWWLSRRLGSRSRQILFLVHNADDHESACWKPRVTDLVLAAGQRFIVHSKADQRVLRQRLPGRQVDFQPMPVFDLFPSVSRGPLPRRAKLELLFFGYVRPYKGLDVLLQALALLKDEDIFLSVVGESWQSVEEFKLELAGLGISHKVEWVGRYVADHEVPAFFERCDWVVLPYRSASGSAVVPLAYQSGRPVLATRVGGLVDVVVHGYTGLLAEPDQPEALATALLDILHNRAGHDPDAIRRACAQMTWEGLARAVLDGGAAMPHGESAIVRTHAIKDRASREIKARKILNLVRARSAATLSTILDVGAGAGYIAHNLAKLTGARVCAVDVADERQVSSGYEFTQVSGVVLPYADHTFDLAISNHVIEHVGNRNAQLQHLQELVRTLKVDGLLYLAVPNRWGVFEPHYRLPLLSWVPRRWADKLLRWTGKSSHYDCHLLSRTDLEQLLSEAGLNGTNLAVDSIREMAALENHRIAALVGHLPGWLLRCLLPWIPTHIYLCSLQAASAAPAPEVNTPTAPPLPQEAASPLGWTERNAP